MGQSQSAQEIPASAYGDDPALYSPSVTPAVFTPHTDADIRCQCGKLLAEFATRPYQVRCPRCKTVKVAVPI